MRGRIVSFTDPLDTIALFMRSFKLPPDDARGNHGRCCDPRGDQNTEAGIVATDMAYVTLTAARSKFALPFSRDLERATAPESGISWRGPANTLRSAAGEPDARIVENSSTWTIQIPTGCVTATTPRTSRTLDRRSLERRRLVRLRVSRITSIAAIGLAFGVRLPSQSRAEPSHV